LFELAHAALQLAACVSCALLWGVMGALGGFSLANLFGILLIGRFVPLRPRYDLGEARRVARIGFPVSLMGMLTVVLATVDRLLVGAFLGIGSLGAYALAVSLSELGVSMAQVVRTVFLRDVYRETQSAETRAVIGPHLAGFSILAPAAAGLIALVLPWCMDEFFPQYRTAALPAQLLLYCGLAQGIINVAVLGIVADGRQGKLPPISVGAVALSAVLVLMVLFSGGGLAGAAAAALLARLAYAAAVVLVLIRLRDVSPPITAFASAFATLVWSASIVFALAYFLPANDLISLLLDVGLYIVCLLPLLPWVSGHLSPQANIRA
jgi:O-antigen/teichoic acid export membrane protein